MPSPWMPHVVEGLPVVEEIELGDDHTCARAVDTIYCWGNNNFGQVGILPEGGSTNVPTPLELNGAVVDFSGGREHTCIVTDTPEILCFGRNLQGELGDGTYDSGPTPRLAAFGCDTPSVRK